MQLFYSDDLSDSQKKELDLFFSVPNQAACLDKLTALLDVNHKNKGAVIKLYLENFKAFNDTFGYHYGGLLLREISHHLCTIPEADVYRTGGVEFVVILDDYSHVEAIDASQEIIERFEKSWHINDVECMCSINLGMAYYPGHAKDAREMFENINYATGEAAYVGQNQLVIYNEDLKLKLRRKSGIAKLIPDALAKGHIDIRYRPTYHVPSGKFTRGDAYLRMFTEEFGIINAAEFIPIAEESGQICEISKYIIRQACKLIATLIEENKEFETISVPISPIQFLQENFVKDVDGAIRHAGIPANKLAFEMTECIVISSFSNVQIRMNKLSEMGVEFVLNEFGSGYSGINHVLSLPVDALKLERMFVWQLETNPRSRYVIQGLIQIAKNIGLKLIADGVETQNQVDILNQDGCEYEQGFYYSPTLTPSDLKTKFETRA